MRNKKVILILMIILCSRNVKAFIPVFDAVNFTKDIDIAAQKILKWLDYLKQFNYYRSKFKELKSRFESTVRKFHPGEIDELFGGVDVDRLMAILESTVYNDPQNLDEWRKIFKDIDKLFVEYPELKNYKFITEKRLYKGIAKENIDIEIKRNNTKLKDYQDIMLKLDEMRKMETELISIKYKGFRDKIDEFSNPKLGQPNLFKVYVLIDLLDMEILKLNYSMMVLLRTYFEMDIKNKVNEMDSIMTEEMYKAKGK